MRPSLATIVSQDPMHVYFDVDERTLLRLRRLHRERKAPAPADARMPVLLALADEQGYPHQGVIDFADNRLDPDTGTLRVRAVFPNHDGLLSPGLFVRIRVPIGGPRKALLVPDRAVGTDQGLKFVYVVDGQDKVEYRHVTVGPLQEDGLRVIETGVRPAERVIVGGLQRVRPRMMVKAQEVPIRQWCRRRGSERPQRRIAGRCRGPGRPCASTTPRTSTSPTSKPCGWWIASRPPGLKPSCPWLIPTASSSPLPRPLY